MLERRAPQPNDRLHRLDIFGADLDTHIAAGAIPHAMALLKGGESGLLGACRLSGICDEAFGFRQRRGARNPCETSCDGAGGHTGPAHDAGIHIVELIGIRQQRSCPEAPYRFVGCVTAVSQG